MVYSVRDDIIKWSSSMKREEKLTECSVICKEFIK